MTRVERRAVLLDTHAFFWAVASPDALGPDAREVIEDPTTSLLVSAATAWELATKVRLGKFPAAEQIIDRFDTVMTALRAEPLSISPSHALRAGRLRWHHRDPFDRMIAAQAMSVPMPLVSRDRAFADVRGLDVIW